MDLLAKIILLPVFACMTLMGVIRRLIGLDPLQIHRPPQADSFWIVRESAHDTQSYFSEQSLAEGRRSHYQGSDLQNGRNGSTLTARFLRKISSLFAPAKVAGTRKIASAADRKQDIPDEIYTLW
jgi:hypothetical protein